VTDYRVLLGDINTPYAKVAAAAMRLQIEELAKTLRVELAIIPFARNADAGLYKFSAEHRLCTIPLIIDPYAELAYAVSLHELGHAATRYQSVALSDYYRQNPIPCEVNAWKWAKAHALVWTPEMQDRMRDSLEAHLDREDRFRVDSNLRLVWDLVD
jgi:hypothetical protein